MLQPPMKSIESQTSWVVAGVSVVLLGLSFGAPWIMVVALKHVAAEAGGARSGPSLAVSLAWFGSGVGGIAMGRIADKLGVRSTVIFGATMIAAGLAVSTFGPGWPLYLGHGLFIGLIGLAGLNAPLYIYVSRWFDRRRGSALALISSGTYVAGALWPPVFERSIAAFGWRATMLGYGLAAAAAIVTLALLFLRPAPEDPLAAPAGAARVAKAGAVLGWPPNLVFGMLAAAIFMCCVTMSMPQSHLVAFCSDLGISATHGAAMLSLLLGTAFVSRQIWGLISDRIGGLHTVIICSACQAAAMTAFLVTQGEGALFIVSAAFGLGFSGLIPAYVLATRELFPSAEASWRIPVILLCSGSGMATGGWLAGFLYDRFGFYGPSFATGIAFNLANFAVVAILVARLHMGSARAGAAGSAGTLPPLGR
ncbi:MAG TPA: MFS transporter [Xanthobacteraceae bacterium]|nr:MFS transporter [Xanthobacteraceae bacterium]